MDQTNNTKPLALVVEDEEYLIEVFTVALEQAGYRVEVANNGKAALEILPTMEPVVILLDLHLPFVSGDEVLEVIQGSEHLADTRIIVASADATWSSYLRGRVDMILDKPVDFEQLRLLSSRFLPTK